MSYAEALHLNPDWGIGIPGQNFGALRGIYSFDVAPEKVHWYVEVFRRSQSDGSLLNPAPRDGEEPVTTTAVSAAQTHPAGKPIRTNIELPYLDPTLGDSYFAILTDPAEVEDVE